MVSGVPLDKNKIIKAIYSKKGIIEQAASIVPCDPTAIYAWMKNDIDVANAVKDARELAQQARVNQEEDIKNKAYESIVHLLEKKDVTATIFTLKSKCDWEKKRESDHSITLQLIDKPYNAKESEHCDKEHTDST